MKKKQLFYTINLFRAVKSFFFIRWCISDQNAPAHLTTKLKEHFLQHNPLPYQYIETNISTSIILIEYWIKISDQNQAKTVLGYKIIVVY